MYRLIGVLALLVIPFSAPPAGDVRPSEPTICPAIDVLRGDSDDSAPGLKKGAPGNATKMSCTGVTCGCDTELDACLAECEGLGDECVRGCRRTYVDCEFCCCTEDPNSWRCQ